jgi:glucosamine--fructose-6-phosphate aminotransferase (isomerizing)
MCGIVGYVGNEQARDILIAALKRLEYRGYDSAGIAVVGKTVQLHKSVGNISKLEEGLPELKGTRGIAHTRWATHGAPNTKNAHPFLDCKGNIALAHNGIIENYEEIKRELVAKGHTFTSETDTEVLVHLIESLYDGNLEKAVRAAIKRVRGSYAIVVVCKDENKIVGVRNESPMVVGVGEKANFLASDVPALLKYTNRVIYLDDGELVVLEPGSVRVTKLDGKPVKKEEHRIEWTIEDAEKGGYAHFMLKEIYEQPKALLDTLIGRIPDLNLGLENVSKDITKVALIACGTAYHAAMVGKYMIERLANLPSSAHIASEFRFSPSVDPGTLAIVISQSGETLDSIMAMREAKRLGCRTVAVCNVTGSTLTREADFTFMTRAGPEIGVAASKTFTTQLVAVLLIATYLGRERRVLDPEEVRHLITEMRQLPRQVQSILDNSGAIKLTAEWISSARDVFFIGRNLNYPIALEGALKLKEISYIHAEGYPAGELKHGPIALFTKETPVIACAVRDKTYDKILGNIRESSARGTPVIAVGFEGDSDLQRYADLVLQIPKVHEIFAPILISVVFQLMAYYVALAKGCPIDMPRNLAKSVTVE